MTSWHNQGLVIAVQPHGEHGAILTLLTEELGKCKGYLRGAQSKKTRGVASLGNLVSANWQGRHEDDLGAFTLELEQSYASRFWNDPLRLQALMAAAALCDKGLAERQPHPAVFYGFNALLDNMAEDNWGALYVAWEVALLREMGFGLDLQNCAGGGDPSMLCYVSPKTGRAVSEEAGAPYSDKLLPLPSFLKPGGNDAGMGEIVKGLEMTTFFFVNCVFAQNSFTIPSQRVLLEEKLREKFQEHEAA